ncbi:hypothetical protein DL766_007644 [Monosporascus sp. MC13-8B]|uniref:Uncharacterized protein n=1 Tax=Monosporascus cannonballus TaxID=155416 RepID=A0ABY0HFG4_9PEZI|nr:hypothetical protein DL762_003200 [Monosporascus cannonballus]RYO99548.1 hypothetical protein DL763_001367 [Monosporascus cannonballus]RYP22801.1 hypothetical protein DL766_007644 [Monosporascus sp. MC13-8B]
MDVPTETSSISGALSSLASGIVDQYQLDGADIVMLASEIYKMRHNMNYDYNQVVHEQKFHCDHHANKDANYNHGLTGHGQVDHERDVHRGRHIFTFLDGRNDHHRQRAHHGQPVYHESNGSNDHHNQHDQHYPHHSPLLRHHYRGSLGDTARQGGPEYLNTLATAAADVDEQANGGHHQLSYCGQQAHQGGQVQQPCLSQLALQGYQIWHNHVDHVNRVDNYQYFHGEQGQQSYRDQNGRSLTNFAQLVPSAAPTLDGNTPLPEDGHQIASNLHQEGWNSRHDNHGHHGSNDHGNRQGNQGYHKRQIGSYTDGTYTRPQNNDPLIDNIVGRYGKQQHVKQHNYQHVSSHDSHGTHPAGHQLDSIFNIDEQFPFECLVRIISDPEAEVPEFLATSEAALQRYSDEEMETILLLAEARFWFRALESHVTYFCYWDVVFSVPRHAHKTMASDNDIRAWTALYIPRHFHHFDKTAVMLSKRERLEDYGEGYAVLRDTYFPGGIDDAVEGFIRHYKKVRKALGKLRYRCLLLVGRPRVPSDSEVVLESLSLIYQVEASLPGMVKRARQWKKATVFNRKKHQLPGADLGLVYGKTVYVDFLQRPTPVIFVMNHDPTQWEGHGVCHGPITLGPGIAWGHWICNVAQERFAKKFHSEDSPLDIHPEPAGTSRTRFEMHLPHGITKLLSHFNATYAAANNAMNKAMPPPEEEKGDEKERAVALSRSTGIHYWNVRPYKKGVFDFQLLIGNNPYLRNRPIYDGAGNLRLDFMNALLHELVHGTSLSGFRHEECALILEDVPTGNY